MHQLTKSLVRHTGQLRRFLEAQRLDVAVGPSDSRVATAIKWLLERQSQEGAWGFQSVACTSLTMIALSDLRSASSAWNLESNVRSALDAGATFLRRAYHDNAYEQAVWDTAIAVRAIAKASSENSEFMRQRTEWLLGLSPTSLNCGPHHLAQRTLTLAEMGSPRDAVERAAMATLDRLGISPHSYSPYVVAQCLEAVLASGVQQEVSTLTEYLVRFLKTTNLDSANFVNVCSSLNALHHVKNIDIENVVRLSVASLFGQTCFRDNGTWYRDPLLTAWALIALTRFSREVVIRIPRSEIMHELNSTESKLLHEVNIAKKGAFVIWVSHTANATVMGGMIVGFIMYTSIKSDMPEWLQWTLGSLISLSVVYVFKYLISYFKRGGAA